MIPWTLVMRIARIPGYPLDFGDALQLIKFNYFKTLASKTDNSQEFLNMMG